MVRDALTLFVEPVLENATLVAAFEGWNDAGEAATGAARYVEAAIHAVPLGEIDGEEFLDFTVRRPWMRAATGAGFAPRDEGERRPEDARSIEWPATRISYGTCDGSRELVVAIGAEPHLRWRAYCDLFAALVRRLRVRRVVLLGAYVADVVYSRPVDVTGFASEADRLAAIGVEPSRYEGPTGIVGVLGEHLRADGVPVLSLWAGLPHYISASPNPRGALALVQKLASDLPLAIDEAPLRAEAAAFEEKISALVSGDPELSEYVRLLKKREFAQ
jgi:PAC2 family